MFRPGRSYLFLIILVIVSFGCKKAEKRVILPEIEFIRDSGFVYADTSIAMGTSIKVGINATGEVANITYLNVKVDNGLVQTALDSGMNTGNLDYSKSIVKSNSPYEIWTFLVMDKNRNMSAVSIKLTKKNTSMFGEINYYPSVILGAQNNNASGHFYSLADNVIYDQQDAFNNQSMIDIIYYYGEYDATLSSPGETEAPGYYTGSTGISNWTIKNTTYYDTTLVTTQQFDSAINDSLLLVQYDQVNGKKKAKFIQAGMVVSFISRTGKIGLLKVISVVGTVDGTVEIAIKVQK